VGAVFALTAPQLHRPWADSVNNPINRHKYILSLTGTTGEKAYEITIGQGAKTRFFEIRFSLGF
jgi:glycine cleavage system aminomethyltransferase T